MTRISISAVLFVAKAKDLRFSPWADTKFTPKKLVVIAKVIKADFINR